MHRFFEKTEIIIIIFSQKGINGRLIQAQQRGEDDEVSKMLGVTNKTIINRCAKLVNNDLLIPIIVKTRIRSYRLSDFSKTNEKKILKKIS